MKKLLLSCFVAAGFAASAQVTGTKTIGTDYPTLADAFTALNTDGVGAGGATINIPAGYTETAPSGGFNLGSATLNASLSTGNELIIQKSGSGANPLLKANTGLGTGDAVVALKGVDYVTFDSVDLEANITNTGTGDVTGLTEYGFGLFNLSATDGCQYNTIKNSTVTFAATSLVHNAAVGVYANPSSYNNGALTAVTLSNATGAHSNNKIYSNTIKNPYIYGIFFNSSTTAAYFGTGNDIGGSAAGTGNSIENVGSAYWVTTAGNANGVTTGYGISASNQNSLNVSYNTVTTANQTTPTIGERFNLGIIGILVSGANSTITVNSNTLTLTPQSYSSSGGNSGISCTTATNLTANNNTITIDLSNQFNGNSPSVFGISGAVTTGAFTAMGNTIKVVGALTRATTATGISTFSTAAVNITDNSISGLKPVTTAYGINMNATGTTANVLRNKIFDFAPTGTGVAHGIYVSANTANSTVNIVNNLIGDLKTPAANATTVSLSGIYFNSGANATTYNVYYNSIYLNATSSGTNFNSTGIYHTFNTTAANAKLDMRNNIIVNLSTPKGTGRATAFRRSASTNLNNYSTDSNNNDFAVGANAMSYIYYDGTNSDDFAAFQGRVTGRETNSLNIAPSFLSTNSSSTDFLKINEIDAINQPLDNKGAVIADYTTDYAGTARHAATPDMGAYEFTYAPPANAPGCTTFIYPANLAANVPAGTVTLTWNPAANSTGYKVYIGTTSGGTDVANGTLVTDTSYSFAASVPFVKYFVKVVPTNAVGDATGCTEIEFTITYCAVDVVNGHTYGNISGVMFADINNDSTGNNIPYKDYSAIVGTVKKETNVAITVNQSFYLAANQNVMSVWIDYNQDGYFTEDERTALTNDGVNPGFTGSIAIPATALEGNTRMRIRLNLQNATPPACGTTNYGQIEDYTVNITPAPNTVPDCTTITSPANNATEVTPNPSVAITWNEAAGANAYKVYIGTTSGGTDVVNGAETVNLSYNTATLNPNTDYYVKVVPKNAVGDAVGCTEIKFTTGATLIIYCTASGPNPAQYDKITRVRFSDIDNSSDATPSAPGYENFTAIIGTVQKGNSYDLILNSTTSYASDRVNVFIDYNNDGIFTANERVVNNLTVTASPWQSAVLSIAIPNTGDVKEGKTRMRVIIHDSADTFTATLPTAGCGTAVYGQVEDYTLDIQKFLATSNVTKTTVSVYPNPFTDVLKISDVKDVKSVSLSDASGRQVRTLKPSAELNLSSLSAGVYVVTLHMNDGSVKTFKAIKK